MEFVDNECCFVCGPKNTEGLRLDWRVEGYEMSTYYTAENKYQGWSGVLHGGIVATLLDEAMTRLVCAVFWPAATAEMTVRYLKPAPVGGNLYIKGEIVKETKRLIETIASIRIDGPEGIVVAHAKGKVMRV